MWLIVGLILGIALLHLLYPKRYHWPSFSRTIEKIPGPTAIPYFGSIPAITATSDGFMSLVLRLINDYVPILRIQVLGNYIIIITDVDDVEKLLGNKSNISKSVNYILLEPWLGTGLLTSTGDKWFKSRRMLTPAFHFGIVEQYVEIYAKNAQVLCDIIDSYGGKEIEINPIIGLCALDIICETAMGVKVNAQRGGEKEYVKGVLEMSTLFQIRQLSPYMFRPFLFALTPTGKRQKKVLETLHGFTDKVIKERTKLFRETQKNKKVEVTENEFGVKAKKSFLDILIEIAEVKKGLSAERIREEVDTFMFEGHDTTSAALSWTLFELSLNPEVQALVHKELDTIFQESDRKVTSSDLAEMKYLERVVKETLRLYPSVPLLARGITEEVTLSGYTVPAGANVAVCTYYIHRDPQLYPNPDKFDPDRFLPERISNRHPYSYIPFSAGPRNCIGQKFALMEEKTVLSEILRRFTVKPVTAREDVEVMAELILRPKKNIKLQFIPRRIK